VWQGRQINKIQAQSARERGGISYDGGGLWTRNTRSADTAKAQLRDTAFCAQTRSVRQRTDETRRLSSRLHAICGEVSMNSPIEHRREGARHERAISSLGDRTGAPLVEARRLVMHLTSPIKPNRFTAELERLWDERPRTAYWRLARSCPGEFVKVLDSLIGSFVPKLTNAKRMLKEQLRADGVGVWVSAGCLAEFARIASLAAARTRQGDESYESCLRREIVTHSRFIREWTSSDEKFDPTRGELISIARRFALPRAWRVTEAVASVRGQTAAGASDALLAVGKKAAEVVAVARPRPRRIPKNTH
jgi:hypothetical protein